MTRRLTGAVEEVLALEESLAGCQNKSRIDIANGDFFANGKRLDRANTKLVAFEIDKRVWVARVVNHGCDHIKRVSDGLLR